MGLSLAHYSGLEYHILTIHEFLLFVTKQAISFRFGLDIPELCDARTPTRVASHAQKYFICLNSMNKVDEHP